MDANDPKQPTFFSGDVIILPKQTRVLVNRQIQWTTDVDKECVVEAARIHEPGLRTDHFGIGEVMDCRPLLAGQYDPTAPLFTVALRGDFDPTLLTQGLKVIRRLQKTYIPIGEQGKG
jgi:hypothetical protein